MNAPVLLSSPPDMPLGPKRTTEADRRIGVRIAALRRLNGLSQETLGRALGLTFQQIQKYEKGVNRVGAVRLQEIARVFEVPVATFFDEEGVGSGLPQGFEGLTVHGAPELLRLFAGIESPSLRQHLLDHARATAHLEQRDTHGPAAARGDG